MPPVQKESRQRPAGFCSTPCTCLTQCNHVLDVVGRPRFLKTPHEGAPASSPACQAMCKAWWGPRVAIMRAQAAKFLATLETVTVQTNSTTFVIPAHGIQIGSLCLVPYEGVVGNYERHESKTGIQLLCSTGPRSLVVACPSPHMVSGRHQPTQRRQPETECANTARRNKWVPRRISKVLADIQDRLPGSPVRDLLHRSAKLDLPCDQPLACDNLAAILHGPAQHLVDLLRRGLYVGRLYHPVA